MASSPDPNSSSCNAAASDPYAQVVNDGQATVALASSFWSFAQPLTQAVTKTVSARQANMQERVRLKRSLGPWYEILKDPESGLLCKQPVVKVDAFRAYMEEKDGIFRPQMPCQVIEGWAVFLHALGIEPATCVKYRLDGETVEESVVSWVPTESTTSKVGLQMTGEVFCHVLNLFSLAGAQYTSSDSKSLTDFGTFWWKGNSLDPVEVLFRQSDTDSVNRSRKPFGNVGKLMDTGTIISMYFEAIHGDSGCSNGTLAFPEPKTDLGIRLATLLRHIMRIETWAEEWKRENPRIDNNAAAIGIKSSPPGPLSISTGNSPHQRPRRSALILSNKWLQNANRVVRRVTTQGGKDSSFLDDCCLRILNMKVGLRIEFVRDAIQIIKDGFMFDDNEYSVKRKAKELQVNRSIEAVEIDLSPKQLACDVIKGTLNAYATSQQSWKKQLYDAQDDVECLLESGHTIQLDPDLICFIGSETMPCSDLWNSKVLLQ